MYCVMHKTGLLNKRGYPLPSRFKKPPIFNLKFLFWTLIIVLMKIDLKNKNEIYYALNTQSLVSVLKKKKIFNPETKRIRTTFIIKHQFQFRFFTPVRSFKCPAMNLCFYLNFKEQVKRNFKKFGHSINNNEQKYMVQRINIVSY